MEITDFSSRNSNTLETEFLQTLHNAGVPLPYFIPKTKENHYFYKNGLSHIIPRLKVKVHSDIENCYELWEKFSPNQTLFDLWDLRYSWYRGYNFKPYFYTVYEKRTPIAVLPLWFDEDEKRYEWFGSWWFEDNKLFAKEDKYIDLLIALAPTPIYLNAIEPGTFLQREKFIELDSDEPKNIKDLSGMKSIDDLLGTYTKKHRYNLKSDFKRIKSLRPRIYIEEANPKLWEELVVMNKSRYNGRNKEKSEFFLEGEVQSYRNLIEKNNIYEAKIIKVVIGGHIAAMDLIFTYKDTYYTVIGGNDVNRFNGIGNFMVYFEFDDAIKNGFKLVDCLQFDYGWKHKYFDQKKVYKFQR